MEREVDVDGEGDGEIGTTALVLAVPSNMPI
jgi:hypothetical protein